MPEQRLRFPRWWEPRRSAYCGCPQCQSARRICGSPFQFGDCDWFTGKPEVNRKTTYRPSVRLTRGCAFPCFHIRQISSKLRLLRLTKIRHKKYRRRAQAVVQLQPGVRVTAGLSLHGSVCQRARLALSAVGQSAGGRLNVRLNSRL